MIYQRYITADAASHETLRRTYRINLPERFNFGYDVVDEIAVMEREKLALLYVNDAGVEKRISFDELRRESNRAANFLRSLGLKKGDVVMTMLKRNYQYWYLAAALCKLGAVLIPAVSLLTSHDITYRNNAAGVKMVVCANEEPLLESVEASLADSPTLTHLALIGDREGWLNFDAGCAAQPDTFQRPQGEEATRAIDPMLIYFTSGTTGQPKMAMHDFRYPLGHVATAKYWHTTREDDLHFTISDTGWAKCGWGKIYGEWLTGCAIFVYDFERFNAKHILEKLEKYRITTFCAPPTMYRMMTQERVEEYDLSSLRHCSSAGEPLNPEVFGDWQRMTGLKIYDGFGQTETTCCLGTLPGMQIKVGAMGMPMPGYDIMLVDENGRMVQGTEAGEICIRVDEGKPAGLFNGYYRDPETTARVCHDGLYHTGDTAWRDEDGYFWYIGRVDDIIKSSGYRIGPFEVESALLEHPAVLEAAITGVPDLIRGQVVKATIVLKPNYLPSEALKQELQNHVKRVTAPYKYPRLIEFVAQLPRTVSGKIKRAQIRQEAAQA